MYDLLVSKWDEIIDTLRYDYDVSDVSLKTWIAPLQVYSVEGNVVNIVFNGDNEIMALQLIRNKYKQIFEVIIEELTGTEMELNFISKTNKNIPNTIIHNTESNDLKKRLEEAHINPKYDFDSFIVGSNNSMAHAVALAVAESPGKIYNPLFIYGGVGLGKTHLMHAIGNFIIKNNPELKVLYTLSETFTNELIDIMRNRKNDNTDFSSFRNKYRNVDVLLIDDIQFIIGKDRTQEEFFHTFNELYMNGKQIIITSDKPPKEMTTLEERFRSRFYEGITVDIQSPDYETRMAILKRNAELHHYKIDESVLTYIANNIVSNIRELEGALNKIIFYSSLTSNKEITLTLAQDALKDVISPDSNKKVTNNLIISVVAEHYGLNVDSILSPKRTKDVSNARQICMYLCKNYTDSTYESIGNALNRKDHSTIIHGVNKIRKNIENDPALKDEINTIIKKFNPS